MSDLDLDFQGYRSRSLKVTFDSDIWHPIYGFILMLNSNIEPNYTEHSFKRYKAC